MAKHTQAIRQAILALIKRNQRANSKIHRMSDDQYAHHVFMYETIRLTRLGNTLLSKIVTPYEYTHNNEFKAKHIMALSNLSYPYYLSPTKFIIYSTDDAIMVSLHGDVTTFLEHSNLFRD